MQLPLPAGTGGLGPGLAVLPEVAPLQHDVQQTGGCARVRAGVGKHVAGQPEVFRQERVELRAPSEQAGTPVGGLQLHGGVAPAQGVVGARHVAELAQADAVPHYMFQQVGVEQQQVRQGRRHGE